MSFRFFKKLTRNILLIPTVVAALLFVASCAASELNPESWWFVGFLSLLLPYLILLLVFACICWLIAKPACVFIPLLALLVGWRQIFAVVGEKHQRRKLFIVGVATLKHRQQQRMSLL